MQNLETELDVLKQPVDLSSSRNFPNSSLGRNHCYRRLWHLRKTFKNNYHKFLSYSKTARIFLFDELTNNVWLTLVYAAATTILGIKNWWKNINLSPYIVSSIYIFLENSPCVSICVRDSRGYGQCPLDKRQCNKIWALYILYF